MGLNRSLQKLAKEIDRLRTRIAELESAVRVLRELEGGELAERKVKQLGKMMQQPDLPIRAKRKITKPIVSANGKTYRRLPREIWQEQIVAFLTKHPGSTNHQVAVATKMNNTASAKRMQRLVADQVVTRTGKQYLVR